MSLHLYFSILVIGIAWVLSQVTMSWRDEALEWHNANRHFADIRFKYILTTTFVYREVLAPFAGTVLVSMIFGLEFYKAKNLFINYLGPVVPLILFIYIQFRYLTMIMKTMQINQR